jgi:hypothetical protein
MGLINFFVTIVECGATTEQYDARLRIVLNRFDDKGFTLNYKKCNSGNNWILFA